MDTNTNQNAQQKRQGQCWPEGIERARRVAVKLHRLEVILHAGLLCDEYAYAGWGGAEDMAAGMKPSLVALDAALDKVAGELGHALSDAPAFLLDGSWDRDANLEPPDVCSGVGDGQRDLETAEANPPPMKRPTPAIVRETIGVLRLAGTTVRVPVLVRALRDQTGCSRASAYRAIHDALAAGAIKCS
jgi:hypothetical protein